jgi:hypothetical protein
MARVTYESKDDAGHKSWVARYGRYAIRIDANRPGVYHWLITLGGRAAWSARGVAPDRDDPRRCRCIGLEPVLRSWGRAPQVLLSAS